MDHVRIVIADDHALVRAGFRILLSAYPDMVVVGEAGDGVEAVEVCRRVLPDVVLLDLSMPGRDGFQAIPDLRKVCPATKVLAVSSYEEAFYVRKALQAGAHGLVGKEVLAEELVAAIRATHQDLPLSAPRWGIPPPPAPRRPSRKENPLAKLTPREREVLRLVALGHTHREIARRLHITVKTVESHRKHLTTKLGLRHRTDLVRFALEHGLIGAVS